MGVLTAAGTLGVSLASPADAHEALLRRAAEAGAGAVRIRGSRESATVRAAEAAGLDVVCAVPATELAHADGAPGALLEIEAATDADRAALPAALAGVGESALLLGLGPISLADVPAPAALPSVPPERVTALAVTVEGITETADPKRMEDALRAAAGPLRAGGWRQPFWLTDLTPAAGLPAEEHAGWLVRHTAHALALTMPRVFLRLPAAHPDPVFQALSMLAAWLEGADRITWLARGQYRAEYTGRPSRFLLWAAPGITRLPSSFQGPLHVRDLAGDERRVETSHLKPAESPLLVERRA